MIKTPAKFYAVYGPADDKGLSKIEGIYNNQKHPVIPEPSLLITTGMAQQIVRRPKIYRVNIELNEIVVVGDRIGGVDPTEVLEQHNSEYQRTVAKGVIVKQTCYWADDEASAHITQCLAILAVDDQFNAELRAIVDGVQKYVKVKPAILKAVAKEVNALRTKAKKILHEQTAVAHNIK